MLRKIDIKSLRCRIVSIVLLVSFITTLTIGPEEAFCLSPQPGTRSSSVKLEAAGASQIAEAAKIIQFLQQELPGVDINNMNDVAVLVHVPSGVTVQTEQGELRLLFGDHVMLRIFVSTSPGQNARSESIAAEWKLFSEAHLAGNMDAQIYENELGGGEPVVTQAKNESPGMGAIRKAAISVLMGLGLAGGYMQLVGCGASQGASKDDGPVVTTVDVPSLKPEDIVFDTEFQAPQVFSVDPSLDLLQVVPRLGSYYELAIVYRHGHGLGELRQPVFMKLYPSGEVRMSRDRSLPKTYTVLGAGEKGDAILTEALPSLRAAIDTWPTSDLSAENRGRFRTSFERASQIFAQDGGYSTGTLTTGGAVPLKVSILESRNWISFDVGASSQAERGYNICISKDGLWMRTNFGVDKNYDGYPWKTYSRSPIFSTIIEKYLTGPVAGAAALDLAGELKTKMIGYRTFLENLKTNCAPDPSQVAYDSGYLSSPLSSRDPEVQLMKLNDGTIAVYTKSRVDPQQNYAVFFYAGNTINVRYPDGTTKTMSWGDTKYGQMAEYYALGPLLAAQRWTDVNVSGEFHYVTSQVFEYVFGSGHSTGWLQNVSVSAKPEQVMIGSAGSCYTILMEPVKGQQYAFTFDYLTKKVGVMYGYNSTDPLSWKIYTETDGDVYFDLVARFLYPAARAAEDRINADHVSWNGSITVLTGYLEDILRTRATNVGKAGAIQGDGAFDGMPVSVPPVPETVNKLPASPDPTVAMLVGAFIGAARKRRQDGNDIPKEMTRATQDLVRNSEAALKSIGIPDTGLFVRVPVEAIAQEGTERQEAVEWLKALNGTANIHVELYSMTSPDADAGDDEYAKLSISRKAVSAGVNKTRENTITLYGAADINVQKKDLTSDIKRSDSFRNSILVPIGLKDDPLGVIRATILGVRLIQIARNPDDTALIQATINGYKSIVDTYSQEPLELSVDDIIALVSGRDINTLTSTLRKLIASLPVVKITSEHIEKTRKLAVEILTKA